MFRYMDYIYRVYVEQSFSKAAESLHIAQSALSITIKKAENQIGMEIFNRQTTPIKLTAFGEKYIESVKIIMQQKADLENYIYSVNNMQRGQLAVGASTFWGVYFVSPAILEFNKKYPNISVELYEDITPTLVEWLLRDRVDILITSSIINSEL